MANHTALVAITLALAAGSAVAAPANFKLKPGAEGKLCIECHAEFQKVMKRQVLHTPVRTRECIGCHNPHAAQHAKLLSDEPGRVCNGCHGNLTPAASRSVHRPAAEGKCLDCHDPHGTAFKGVLVRGGVDLCGGCHKAMVDRVKVVKVKHAPMQSVGCGACHEPHASAKADSVLKKPVPALCADCHKLDRPVFAKQHLDYPVGKSDCTSCHDPHGSDRKGMLYDRVHSPVARGMCAQCHQPANSPNALKTKQEGLDLCRGCHAPLVNQVLASNRVHLPILERRACLSCHNPHASKQKALLPRPMKVVCGKCHEDTIKRELNSPTKHEPVRDGDCTACHDPHAGQAALFFKEADGVKLCGTCHDWAEHSAHPIGAKIPDPRNRNRTVDCLSCHRAHGTEFKKMMPYGKVSEMCTKCHEQYRR